MKIPTILGNISNNTITSIVNIIFLVVQNLFFNI
nr:MAG TPA: hypothetical protein [Microviridae sp.]